MPRPPKIYHVNSERRISPRRQLNVVLPPSRSLGSQIADFSQTVAFEKGEIGEFLPIRFRRFRRHFRHSDQQLVTRCGEGWQKRRVPLMTLG